MFFDKRGARTSGGRRHRFTVRLHPEALERRELLTANLDISQIATKPLGVQETGVAAGGGAGWSVVDVGNVTGSGYDSFVVGAPSVVRSGSSVNLGNNTPPGTAYLIFGSAGVNLGTVNFALLNTQNRIGDLSALNSTIQFNPANGNQGFPFAGVTIQTLNSNAKLGVSVAAIGDINGDGIADFMIGAPGAQNASGGADNTGRAYIILGGAALTSSANNSAINVDIPSTYRTNVITLVSNRTGGTNGNRLGAAVAGVGDVFANGIPDVAVSAPGATVNGNDSAGAVYLISGAFLRNAPFGAVYDVDNVGQTIPGAVPSGVIAGTVPGVIFSGANNGDQAGFSLGGDVSFDGATLLNKPISDLLIGAPQPGTGAGKAYLIYGSLNLSKFATSTTGDPLSPLQIPLSTVGTSDTLPTIPSTVFTGAVSGDLLGYSVASAGAFFGGTTGAILLGAPNANGGTGAAYLVKGNPLSTRITTPISLSAIPAGVTVATFRGEGQGDRAGTSVTAVGDINGDGLNEIAIGAPGYNAGYGAVYLIPGSANLSGAFSLSSIGGTIISGSRITVPSGALGSIGPAALGQSVSGRLSFLGQTKTIDTDNLGDLIIGAPGYSLATIGSNPPSTSRNIAGAAFALEGTFLASAIGPAGIGNGNNNAKIQPTVTINSQTAPFTVNASNSSLLIYVFDDPASGFVASADINPTTIVVNGVAFPNATLTAGNGFAIITITPVSALKLSNGLTKFTISGITTTAAGAVTFSGSNTATVTNASGNGGGSGFLLGSVPLGFRQITSFPPPNGEHLVPTLDQFVSPAGYQPLPVSVVLSQFEPALAYIARKRHGIGGTPAGATPNPNALIVKFGHQSNGLNYAVPKRGNASWRPFKPNGVHTLSSRVFTRDIYHPGKTIVVKHKVAVVPKNEQTQVKR